MLFGGGRDSGPRGTLKKIFRKDHKIIVGGGRLQGGLITI